MVINKVVRSARLANIHGEKEVLSHLLDCLDSMVAHDVESFERRLKRAFDASKVESVWDSILQVKKAHGEWAAAQKAEAAKAKPDFSATS